MDQHPPPSSSRSPRSRLVIGGRMVPAQLHQAPPANHQHQQQQKQDMTADERNGQELRALDCNLSALCDHIQVEGFHAGAFSDVAVHAMGSTYRLHRLILSRSSYFRNMLHGPWKEAGAPTVTLEIDDENVNSEAISMSLAYIYGHHPKLDDSNAFRVLAAASFLDLQDLCAICTDFIISELRTSNFLAYQVFTESQDYGIHGDRVRKACWGYLCQSGARELREVLSRLSSQTLQSLLTSDKLWVPNEEKRFELALYTLLAKVAMNKEQMEQSLSSSEPGLSTPPQSSVGMGCNFMNDGITRVLQSELEHISVQDNSKGHKAAHKVLDELTKCAVDFRNDVSYPNSVHEINSCQLVTDSYSCQMERSASSNSSLFDPSVVHTSCSQMQNDHDIKRTVVNGSATEGPSEESTCYSFQNNVWLSGDHSRQFTSDGPACNETVNIDQGKHGMVSPSWGARTVGWCHGKSVEENYGIFGEEYDAFANIFEGGSLLYCNMSFEALLDARKKLEEMGFPCKAVNDGLWLQMLLSHRIQEVGADTCRNCCLASMSCACRQPYGYPHGGSFLECQRQENDRNHTPGIGNVYLADAQGEENGVYEPVRIHARGAIDGLAGIGRGATFVSNSAWPPTRFVFSRVPFGLGNRNCQQSLGNDEPEASAELSGDGLTAFVGSSQGANMVPVHMEHADRAYVSGPNIPETNKHTLGLDWEDSEVSSLSLDMKTPLRHFPPFRFGVEFEDVHRLGDGQVKHSSEMFYAGSLWKVSVQAFNDEDPQGRRTLGLFLHRRKAELNEPLRKVHTYVDSREKVTARYQLICPSKREIMVFGSLKQPGTLLPKAPKGWGWRTALLFDELADLLQGGSLRVAAVVQLI